MKLSSSPSMIFPRLRALMLHATGQTEFIARNDTEVSRAQTHVGALLNRAEKINERAGLIRRLNSGARGPSPTRRVRQRRLCNFSDLRDVFVNVLVERRHLLGRHA